MRCSLPIALALPACPLSAQASPAAFAVYSDATTATSRAGIPSTGPGDLLVQVHRDAFRGVGTTLRHPRRPAGRVVGFQAALQSSVAAESFEFALYHDDPESPGQPDAAGAVLRTTAMLTPGPGAWVITVTLATPAAVIPRDDTWYFGVGLFPGAGTGLSVHMAAYPLPGFPGGENPRPGAPNVTWTVQGGAAAQPSPARAHHLVLHTDGAVLHNGADIAPALRSGPNPDFGVAGIYPDNSGRADGLAFSVRDPRAVGGPVAVHAAPTFSPPDDAPFLAGFLLIELSRSVQLAAGTMPASGELVLQPPFLAQGQLPAGIRGTVAFQAFTVGGGLIRASNATATSFQ